MTIAQMTPAILALLSVIAPGVAAWVKLQEVLRPLLARRRLRVAIVASAEVDGEARAFAASLRSAGFREVAVTRDSSAVLGRQVVVLWRPAADRAAGIVSAAQAVAPEAQILCLTYDQLQVPRGPQILLCNHALRLRGDLAAVAEAVRT